MNIVKRVDVAAKLYEQALLPIFNHADMGVCKKIVTACYNGGQRIMEYTNRGNYASEIYFELRKFVSENYPDMYFGAGTIIDAPTAIHFIQMGADFIVSPILNQEMAKVCNRRKVLWIPGCGTLSEMNQAEEWGAELVKAFPANTIGGADFINAIKGPCPWTSVLVTGGAKPEYDNLKEWFEAGAECVGMGSKLITKEVIENQDFELLTKNVQNALEIIGKVKESIR